MLRSSERVQVVQVYICILSFFRAVQSMRGRRRRACKGVWVVKTVGCVGWAADSLVGAASGPGGEGQGRRRGGDKSRRPRVEALQERHVICSEYDLLLTIVVRLHKGGLLSGQDDWSKEDEKYAIDIAICVQRTATRGAWAQESGVRTGPRASSALRCPAGRARRVSARPVGQCETRRVRTVFETMSANSSNESLPSPSRSASMIVLSTICCSCWSFKLFPTCVGASACTGCQTRTRTNAPSS
jgi:hypothetical protein